MSASTPQRQSAQITRIGELASNDLAWLEQNAPKTYDKLMEAERHQQRRDWADLLSQALGHLAGLAGLSILTVLAWHAFDLGAATQGATIICTGAVSTVTVFVTGRLTSGRPKATSSSQKST